MLGSVSQRCSVHAQRISRARRDDRVGKRQERVDPRVAASVLQTSIELVGLLRRVGSEVMRSPFSNLAAQRLVTTRIESLCDKDRIGERIHVVWR